MSVPSQHSFTKLKRLVLYLKEERQWSQVFEFWNMSSEVTVFSDSDWTGDKETWKLSSAGSRARRTTPSQVSHSQLNIISSQNKHIDVAHLRLQDDVKSNRLKVRRVKSVDNLADRDQGAQQ